MGRLVCTLIRNAVNTDRSLGGEHVDGCIIMNLWHRMWENIHADDEDGVLDALDLDGDGQISVEEIHAALARILGMSTDCTQMALARYVHRFADVNGHGEVTRDDLLRFVRDEGLFSDYEDGLRVRA